MDVKKILLITLIAVAILASVSAVSAGLFDGLFGEEQKDNVIEIDHITFNTTNETNFTHFKKADVKNEYYKTKTYGIKENGTLGHYRITITHFNDKNTFSNGIKSFKEQYDTKYIINGTEVYLGKITSGKFVGDTVYVTWVYNSELNECVVVLTPDANETAKIASTMKFN